VEAHVTQALDNWYGAWALQQETAQDAFNAAFPALDPADRCQCFGPTLRWMTPGEGTGKVCLDDHGRVTIEFENVPKGAVGTAMKECWGADWFDEGPDGFAEAEPGQYHYEDEQTYAEYEFDVNADGTVTFGISYVKVDDIVTMLDALERALAIQRPA
jgi:predicted dehydrogenase